MNTVVRSDSSSGYKNIQKRGNKYRAYLTRDGKRHNIGTFTTVEAANNALLTKWCNVCKEDVNPGDHVCLI